MSFFLQFVCGLMFGAACWAAGDLIYKLLSDEPLPLVARHSVAFAIGNVAFSYGLTALGFAGLFIPWVLRAVLLAGLTLAIWKVIGRGKSLFSRLADQALRKSIENGTFNIRTMDNDSDNQTRKTNHQERIRLFFLIGTIAIFLIVPILQAAAPPYVRDSLVYHLLCPIEYLRACGLVHIPGNLYSAFPKGHEVIMTLLLAVSGDRAAQGFSILQQIAAIGELYGLTYLMAGPLPAAICTVGYATVPPVMYFTGCGYVEPALLMTLGGTLLVLFLCLQSVRTVGMDSNMDPGPILLLGFLAGWMPALKYSGLIYLGLVGLILMWRYRKVSFKKALSAIGVFSIFAAPGLCWMVWDWVDLGNPVYPMAWFLFGGRGWDEARAFAMSQYFDAYGMGKNLSDYLLLPWRLAFSGRFDTILFDGAMGPFLVVFLLLAIGTAILLIRRRLVNDIMKEIGVMFVISAAFFVFGTQQVRFWVPSQMLLCVFIAPAVGLLVDSDKGKGMLKVALILVVVGSFAWNMWFLGKQFLAVGYYKPILGMEQEKDFLARKVPGYPAIEFVNENLSSGSRLLCVWTGAYGYYLNRKYYSDTFIEDFTLKKFIHDSINSKELSQKLTHAGFTHLFLNFSILKKNISQNEQVIFEDFLKNETRELFRHQNFGVLEMSSLSH